ncbi:MAG: hypothetical protein HYU25_11000 [Candidatus Rokubacteria bacterium]|nr:hypothetical protein [Candidatus Rokubacteria bacterium]
MSELAAQLVDRVIPHVPVRQWVLSLPWSLRYQLAFDAGLCRDVLAVFMRVVFGWLSASLEGFSLHANVALPAHAREQLEHLCRPSRRRAGQRRN